MRTYAGHSSAAASNALFRRNLAKGQTGLSVAFDLPTQTGYDPDHELARRRGRPGRRAGGAPRRRAGALRRPRSGRGQHVDDDQRDGHVAARALRHRGPGAGRRPGRAARHHPERHREGVPVPRYLHLPARPVAAADHRHDRVDGAQLSEVEPGEHLLLPPAGGRGHAGAGGRVRAGHRGRRARRGARLGAGAAAADGRRRGPHLVLRQLRRALRRGDVQDARVRRGSGTSSPRSATACRTPSSAGSGTGCRSTRSA